MVALIVLLAVSAHGSVVSSDDRVLETRFAEDLTRVEAWRNFQATLIQEVERLLLRAGDDPTLAPGDAARLRRAWSGIVDLQLALDVVDRRWRDRSTLRESTLDRATATSYSAWLARTAGAIAVVRLGRQHPRFQGMFDDPLAHLGLPAGTWSRIAQNTESAQTSAEYLAFEVLYGAALRSNRVAPSRAVTEDAAKIAAWLSVRGVVSAAQNASRLLSSDTRSALNTLTSAASPWFGNAQRFRRTRPFIGSAWLGRIVPQLQPGDLILIRHEWEPADAGHESFWGDAAIWIGTPSERRHYFGDAASLAVIRNEGYEDIDALLRARSPSAYGGSLAPGAEPARLIRTTPLGVSLGGSSTLQADSIAVLRLRRAPLERARVVQRAFEMVGRAYDASGDLYEPSAIGSAELFLTAIGEHAPRLQGTRAGLDDLVSWIDAHGGEDNPTFELVLFLDGQELSRSVKMESPELFRTTWTRPAWRSWLAAAAMNQVR